MKLATVACLHGDIGNARKFAARFRKENVDAIALVGDIASDEKQKQNLTKILKIFFQTKKKIFVLPGNHEQLVAYSNTMKLFKKNKNIIDCSKNPKIEFGGQKFVFWPGSGTAHAPGAGFFLLPNKRRTDRLKKKIKKFKSHFFGSVEFIFMNDFAKYLDEDTVVITHSPTKFNTKNAIDAAKFGTPTKPFSLLEKHKRFNKTTEMRMFVPGHAIFPMYEAKHFLKYGYPVKILQENVGNEDYRKILKKYKISKFICGDIHEAGGRANDWRGRAVKQNHWSKELFYNCSAGKEGRAGIVEFLNDKVKYKVVKV